MTESKYFALSGGMDSVTPSIVTPPGRVVSGINYESSPRGYQRIDGWERFDGRTKPSEALFAAASFEAGTFAPATGDVLTGSSSGKTAKVLFAPSVYEGSFSAGTAVGTIALIDNTGLLAGELVSIGVFPAATLTTTPGEAGPITSEEERDWAMAARSELRSRIGAVPGSGPVRGIQTYEGNVYAFRDNALATAGGMWKATPTGWQAVAFGKSLSFDAGTIAMTVGELVTGSTSGATGIIKKVILQDGDWTTDDAVGRLLFATVTGTFADNEIILTPSAGSAVVNGLISQIALPPGGRYHFDNNNFLGTTGSLNMYGVNGVGPAFEFDGETLTPILTGEENDTPIRVAAHKDHLFLAYINGRFIHSAIFKPLNFEIILGSLLAGIGEEIADMVPTATGELAIFGRNKVCVLYGTNAENWNLVTLTNESGAVPWTTQLIGAPLYLDHVGVRSLDSTQSYGNFSLGTKTQPIQPKITNKIKANIDAVASLRIRKKDSYRLYWADGTALAIYFGRKQPENMLLNIGFAPSCTCSGEDADGREILFVGASTGYVYQMDSGSSADGEPIVAYVRLPFNHVGSPSYDKRWHKAVLEVDASPQTKISVVYACSYADIDLPQPSEQDFLLHGGGGLWNEAVWNQFYWSANVEGTADVDLEGIGKNLSLIVISEEDYPEPHTIHGVSLHYNYRRMQR